MSSTAGPLRRFPAVRARFLLIVASACLLVILAQRDNADRRTRLDAVFEAIAAVVPHPAPVVEVDLHDGRSPIPLRWEQHFARFAAADRAQPPVAGGVVFVGSSSIDFWRDLPAQFPAHRVTQRGLAGATMADCLRLVDRLVLPYHPRTVVIYAGDNDLAAGTTPEQILAQYVDLVRAVRRDLPAAKLVFVSIKPSPSRTALMPLIRHTNRLIADYTAADPALAFVDVFAAMLDHDAQVRRELFLADGLHMAAPGYLLWHDAIVHHLN